MTEKSKSFIKESYCFEDLVELLAFLRSEEGCPWDRAQTHRSIRKNLIEECYETVEGIDTQDSSLLSEELGDLLLQVVFHARISEEEEEFTIHDVINGVCRKMIRRHPNIFSEEFQTRACSPEVAYAGWDEVKKEEKGTKTVYETLCLVSKALPSLMRTQKLLSKTEKAGFIHGEKPESTEDKLLTRYFELCVEANALGIDLEELAYKGNEKFILEMKKREETR